MTSFLVRVHRAIKWHGNIATSVLLLCGASSTSGLPLVAGNFNIAQQFLHGDARVLLVGDSEQNGLIGAYPARWKIDRWVGEVVGPNLSQGFYGNSGAFDFHFDGSPLLASDQYTYADEVGPAGRGTGPGNTTSLTFNGTTAGPADNILSNRVYSASLTPNQATTFYSGAWADRPTGTIHADVLYYANPSGIASGVEFDARINSNATPAASVAINAQAPTLQLKVASVTFPAETWQPGNNLNGDFRLLPGTTPTAGSNLIIAGVRYYTGESGFQLANISAGGRTVDYFLDQANVSDANLASYLSATDTNIAYIWLGQNSVGTDSPAAWKSKMQSLIGRYKQAKPDMRFVLVSTYDTGNPDLAGYAQDLYEISLSDSSVLFLNLYQSAGNYDFLDANYLADHVHPSVAGIPYFADQTNSLLEMAAANVPEPSGAILLLWGCAAMGFSRRRRAL